MIVKMKYNEYFNLISKLKYLNKELEIQKSFVDNLKENLKNLTNIIKEKEDLNNINNIRKNLRAVLFTCIDPNINYAIPCLSIDKFSDVENKLYQEYSQLKNSGKRYFFIKSGKVINNNTDTIDRCKVGDGCPIIIQAQNLYSTNSMNLIHNP